MMIKSGWLKKIIIVALALSMCLESFAAVVGDNDGSAFVTKLEFDALKNDFAAQIDNYNDSISGKLDGAIAAYLAGLNIQKKEQVPLLVNNWETVTELNGALKQKYDYPDVNASVVVCQKIIEFGSTAAELGNTTTMSKGTEYFKQLWCTAKASYSKTAPTSTRNLVGNVVIQSTPDKSNMVWKGHANQAKESWVLSIVRTYTNNPSSLVTDSLYNAFVICEFLNLIRTGYISSFIDTSNPIWKPGIRWRDNGGTYHNWGYGTTVAISTIPTITYEKDSSGKVKSYEHILSHKSTDNWEICAEGVTNYIAFSTNNTNKTAEWANITSNSGVWHGCEYSFGRSSVASKNVKLLGLQIDKDVLWTDNTYTGATNNKQIPVIGLLGTATSGSIYQFSDNELRDDDGVSLDKRKLHEGLPIMKVNALEMIEWTPEFKDIKVEGVTGVTECKVKLSYVPFTNEGTVGNINDLVKMDGVTLNDWAKTSGGKVNIKFESDRAGYVYAKWVPDTTDSNISNKFWEVTLDVKNCNKYSSVKD